MYRKILIMLAAAGLGVSVAACSAAVPGQSAASEQVAQTAAAVASAIPREAGFGARALLGLRATIM